MTALPGWKRLLHVTDYESIKSLVQELQRLCSERRVFPALFFFSVSDYILIVKMIVTILVRLTINIDTLFAASECKFSFFS
jgi:hypothetical protein